MEKTMPINNLQPTEPSDSSAAGGWIMPTLEILLQGAIVALQIAIYVAQIAARVMLEVVVLLALTFASLFRVR
jgi:hypothetical protein